MMASHGVEVIGTDYNKELVATLNAGARGYDDIDGIGSGGILSADTGGARGGRTADAQHLQPVA